MKENEKRKKNKKLQKSLSRFCHVFRDRVVKPLIFDCQLMPTFHQQLQVNLCWVNATEGGQQQETLQVFRHFIHLSGMAALLNSVFNLRLFLSYVIKAMRDFTSVERPDRWNYYYMQNSKCFICTSNCFFIMQGHSIAKYFSSCIPTKLPKCE